jgi:NAD(P)-dependent dehydrogenase (short-subunit alcohol dehydrogenase family)
MANILVTGAARGIGHELVQRAIKRGDTVFACVRKEADRSRFPAAPNLHVVLMDVADTASVGRAFEEVDRLLAGKKLDGVINPAAVQITGAIEVAPVEEFEHTLNTNTLGSLRIIKAAIPRLRGHGGRLILVTSLWGRASGVLLGAYCASKHAIESLADVARRETLGMNMHVIVAEPGVVLTDMYTTQADEVDKCVARMSPEQRRLYENLHLRYRKLVEGGGSTAITATRAAENIEKALFARKPRVRYRFGNDSRIVVLLTWLLPDRWMDGLLGVSLNHKPLR